MTKILPCRFKQTFGSFNMFTIRRCSDSELFRHLSNAAFSSLQFHKEMTFEGHIVFQSIPNFYVHSGNAAKKLRILFLILRYMHLN